MPLESIFEPPPLPRGRPWGRIFLTALAVLLFATALYFEFRDFREEQAVKTFFDALARQDFRSAYQIWKPSPSYSIGNFMEDWGPSGPWGPIKSFKILDSSRRGASVVVTVRINDRADPADIWVSRRDRSFSFPPF